MAKVTQRTIPSNCDPRLFGNFETHKDSQEYTLAVFVSVLEKNYLPTYIAAVRTTTTSVFVADINRATLDMLLKDPKVKYVSGSHEISLED